MTHDPLCARTPTGVHYVGTCTCNLIAKVRADTLNKAREAVVAVPWQSSMLGATVMRVDVVAAVDSLVAEATPVQGTKAG